MRKTLNRALLRKVAQKLRRLRHEGHYSQDVFARRTECGTAACIAGHAVLVAGYRLSLNDAGYFDCTKGAMVADIQERAVAELRLPDPGPFGIPWLFAWNPDEKWPPPYANRWRDARNGKSKERPSRIAADLLDAIADGKIKL